MPPNSPTLISMFHTYLSASQAPELFGLPLPCLLQNPVYVKEIILVSRAALLIPLSLPKVVSLDKSIHSRHPNLNSFTN